MALGQNLISDSYSNNCVHLQLLDDLIYFLTRRLSVMPSAQARVLILPHLEIPLLNLGLALEILLLRPSMHQDCS